jgi:hypothetical protein
VLDNATLGACYCVVTSALVVTAACASFRWLPLYGEHPPGRRDAAVEAFLAWDGQWYREIALQGYHFEREERSNIAFFPAYPLLVRLAAKTVDPAWAQVIVANAAFAVACGLWVAYVRSRYPHIDETLADWSLLALTLFPTSFYFRMGYSESTFLCLALASMLGMQRRWPLWLIAALIGAATASRSVGVALLVPFAVHLREVSARWRGWLLRGTLLMPLACWGLVAWMAWQSAQFGDPLAFARAQYQWRVRPLPQSPLTYLVSLVTLEPLRAIYDPDCPCHWSRFPSEVAPYLHVHAFQPIYFLLTAALLAIGYRRRWLSPKESTLGAALLLIPYVTHAYWACMLSEARFAAVVFPAYLVLGRGLHAAPRWLSLIVLAGCAALLCAYAALFAAWYWVF